MSPDSGLQGVLFDYGGVLTGSVRAAFEQWMLEDQIDQDSVRRTLRAWLTPNGSAPSPLHRLETGDLSGPDFARELARQLRRVDGSAVVPDRLLDRMFAQVLIDDAMCDLVRECRQRGLRTALLSNSWGNSYPDELLADLFDVVIISSQVGLRKPDPRIFRLTLDRLDVAPERSAFLDDLPLNVDGARTVGILAHRHVDAPSSRAWLQTLAPALAGPARDFTGDLT